MVTLSSHLASHSLCMACDQHAVAAVSYTLYAFLIHDYSLLLPLVHSFALVLSSNLICQSDYYPNQQIFFQSYFLLILRIYWWQSLIRLGNIAILLPLCNIRVCNTVSNKTSMIQNFFGFRVISINCKSFPYQFQLLCFYIHCSKTMACVCMHVCVCVRAYGNMCMCVCVQMFVLGMEQHQFYYCLLYIYNGSYHGKNIFTTTIIIISVTPCAQHA